MAEKPLGVRSIRCKDESINKCPNEPLKYVGTCWNQLEPSGFPKIHHFFKGGFWGSSRVNRASLCPRAEDVSTLPWRRWSCWSPLVHSLVLPPSPITGHLILDMLHMLHLMLHLLLKGSCRPATEKRDATRCERSRKRRLVPGGFNK